MLLFHKSVPFPLEWRIFCGNIFNLKKLSKSAKDGILSKENAFIVQKVSLAEFDDGKYASGGGRLVKLQVNFFLNRERFQFFHRMHNGKCFTKKNLKKKLVFCEKNLIFGYTGTFLCFFPTSFQ